MMPLPDWRIELAEIVLHVLAALLAIWAGTGRPAWFVRGSLVLLGAACLLPARAFPPAMFLLGQAALVAGGCAVVSWRSWRYRFSLTELLAATTLIAGGLGMAIYCLPRISRDVGVPFVCVIGGESALTMSIAWLVFGRGEPRWRWVRWSLPLVLLGCVTVLRIMNEETYRFYQEISLPMDRDLLSQVFWRGLRATVGMGLGVWLSLTIIMAVQNREATPSRARVLGWIGLGVVPLLLLPCLGSVWWRMVFLPRPPLVALPANNGFDRLCQLANRAPPDWELRLGRSVTPQERRAWIAACQPIADAATQALELPWRRPLRYDGSEAAWEEGLADPLLQLVRLLSETAEVQAADGREADAARTRVAILHIGAKLQLDGLVADSLLGTGIQQIGLRPIHSWGRLDAQANREIVAKLSVIERLRPSEADLFERERIWTLHNVGYSAAFVDAVSPGSLTEQQPVRRSLQVATTAVRLLMLELAIRQFQIERGHSPRQLADLVPGYLPHSLVDGFHDRPFVYREAPDGGYVLYSCGPDGVDEGGVNLKWFQILSGHAGDFFLEQLDEPALDGP